jgi:RNA polymerase sigma-70 factor (ECF subfamily)
LYIDHVDRLWRFARRIGVPPSDVEDVVQEVFIVAHRRLAGFDGAVPVSTWLFAIAIRTAKAHKRRAFRRRLAGLVGFAPEPVRAPDGDLERRDAEAELGAILDRMNPKKRTVFVLHELEELDGAAIAGIVECSVHTVWSRLRLAREEIERIVRRRRAAGAAS